MKIITKAIALVRTVKKAQVKIVKIVQVKKAKIVQVKKAKMVQMNYQNKVKEIQRPAKKDKTCNHRQIKKVKK